MADNITTQNNHKESDGVPECCDFKTLEFVSVPSSDYQHSRIQSNYKIRTRNQTKGPTTQW